MKRITIFLTALAVSCFALLGVISMPTIAQNVACYMNQGGTSWTAGSGCTWTVASGGIINIASGGQLQVAGADVTSSVAGAAVAGVASGYKLARGETALDGSNPTPVTTGLSTITGCSLTIKTTSAPGVSTSVVTYGTSSGTMNMYGWKVTATGDATLVASTATDTIGWVCVGT